MEKNEIKTRVESAYIMLVWIVLGPYYFFRIYIFQQIFDDFQLLSSIFSTDGLLFCLAITFVKVLELLRMCLYNIFVRFLLIFAVYIIGYGLIAPPYMFVSFYQPFGRNVILHLTLIFILIDFGFQLYRTK
jgi:hypothetical protein